MQPVVDETKFWRHFTKHEAFVRRARDKEIVWSESLRQETTFLALVLSVMVVGLINSLDPQLFCHFRDRHETPVSKFLNMVIRLLHVLDFHERPTLDTIRVGIVAYHSMFQSCTSWASDVFISVLTQDAIRLDLQKDPPPDCPTDEFFDRINIWVGALLLECFSTVKVGRSPIVNCDYPFSSPSFLYSRNSWDQASLHGPWPYLHKVSTITFNLSALLLPTGLTRFC